MSPWPSIFIQKVNYQLFYVASLWADVRFLKNVHLQKWNRPPKHFAGASHRTLAFFHHCYVQHPKLPPFIVDNGEEKEIVGPFKEGPARRLKRRQHSPSKLIWPKAECRTPFLIFLSSSPTPPPPPLQKIGYIGPWPIGRNKGELELC